jgi:hypothetical protein
MRKPTKKEIKEFARIEVDRQFNHFIKKYDLEQHLNKRFSTVKLTVSFDKRRVSTWGGAKLTHMRNSKKIKIRPYISIDAKDFLNFKYHKFSEYEHLSESKIIGDIRVANWQEYMIALISHEISHCFQLMIEYDSDAIGYFIKGYKPLFNNKINHFYKHVLINAYETKDFIEVGHGKLFQEIYKVFRKKFVNKK